MEEIIVWHEIDQKDTTTWPEDYKRKLFTIDEGTVIFGYISHPWNHPYGDPYTCKQIYCMYNQSWINRKRATAWADEPKGYRKEI